MRSFTFAFKQIIPLIFPYLFVGLAFGILLSEAGYSIFWCLIADFFVYAGSMQLIMVSLMAQGASLVSLAVMTLFINARHMFYGLGFIEKFKAYGGWKYPYMVLTMTDETYSVLCSVKYPEDVDEKKAGFYIQLICHFMWQVFGLLGYLAGRLLPVDLTGIDFAATAFFVTVVVRQWQQFGSRIPALTGLVCAIGFYLLLGPGKFILPALSVSLVVLVILRDRVNLKMGGIEHA